MLIDAGSLAVVLDGHHRCLVNESVVGSHVHLLPVALALADGGAYLGVLHYLVVHLDSVLVGHIVAVHALCDLLEDYHLGLAALRAHVL